MTTTWADLRLAARGLRRNPLFATVAILSLALGIGANTAIFTLIDQILLRKLPVKSPDELVMLFQRGSHNGSNMGTRMHSYPIYQDYQKKAESLAEVLCRRLVPASVSVDNQTERVLAEMVSGNYFSMSIAVWLFIRSKPAAFARAAITLSRSGRTGMNCTVKARPTSRLFG